MKFFETSKFHTLKKSTYISLRWIGIIGQLISFYVVYFFTGFCPNYTLDSKCNQGPTPVIFLITL